MCIRIEVLINLFNEIINLRALKFIYETTEKRFVMIRNFKRLASLEIAGNLLLLGRVLGD
jgi:hypothetical protein